MADSFQEKDNALGHMEGTTATQLISFHGATPVAQRAGAAQDAVTATVGANIAAFTDPPSAGEMTTLVSFANALKADNARLIVLTNELRAALVAKGLIKGAA